jgi:hypothetical protein
MRFFLAIIQSIVLIITPALALKKDAPPLLAGPAGVPTCPLAHLFVETDLVVVAPESHSPVDRIGSFCLEHHGIDRVEQARPARVCSVATREDAVADAAFQREVRMLDAVA